MDLSVVYSANLITIINYVNYYIIELTITPNAFIGIMVITSSLMVIISYRYAKNQEEDINIYKKSIERYEQLILRDKQIRDKGPIEYLKSEECKKIQNEFHSMLKLLKTQDIWFINFRRDGEAPESDFEDYLAKLSETEFVNHMKSKYKINIKKIEKENM